MRSDSAPPPSLQLLDCNARVVQEPQLEETPSVCGTERILDAERYTQRVEDTMHKYLTVGEEGLDKRSEAGECRLRRPDVRLQLVVQVARLERLFVVRGFPCF
jgi:hypothetical protein